MKQNKNILVVEDEEPLLKAISIKLKKEGFSVLSARSADEALEHLNKVKEIAAIWLDHYLLGKQTGLDFLTSVKSNEHLRDVPIFVVTNTGAPDKKENYTSLGIVKFYLKAAFDLEEIVNDIKAQLK